jgi:ABC-2 type transport system permease protein
MRALTQRLSVLRAVAQVTYKEWAAYRTHSLISVFVGPVYFFIQYCIWGAVYGGHGGLRGMGLQQTLAYFGASALIGYLTMDFADWNLQMLVRTGKFLTFSLRPVHHRFFALSQKVGHRALGLVFEFLPCLAIFLFVFKLPLIPAYPLWAGLSVILAFFMNFYVNYCISLSAFWFVRAEGVRAVFQILLNVFSGSLVPLVFFPAVVQKALFFLPFQYLIYVPAMVWTGSYRLGGM